MAFPQNVIYKDIYKQRIKVKLKKNRLMHSNIYPIGLFICKKKKNYKMMKGTIQHQTTYY